MRLLNKIKRYFTDANYRFLVNNSRGLCNSMDDEKYLKLLYKARMGKELDVDNPKTFNEKLQWLKIYDRNPLYTKLVDKYEVKEYVSSIIGEEYIIPTLGVWDSADDIDFDKLPNQFVLKCTHDSGGIVICKDKENFDITKTKQVLSDSLKTDYYILGREWPYKNVPRRIIAEQYMEDRTISELRDYKIFCFNGKVRCFKIDFDRFSNHRANYYTQNKELLYFGETICPPDFNKELEMPETLEKMFELAEKLSEDKPFVRVDFYEVNKNIYFGEMTFYPAAGFGKFEPEEWDYKLGEWIDLPQKNRE